MIELASDEIGYSAGELSKQSVQGAIWLPLVLTAECEWTDKLKKSLNKKES